MPPKRAVPADATKPPPPKRVATPQAVPNAPIPITGHHDERLRVFVFGDGSSGQLGLGPSSSTEIPRPKPNPNLDGVVALAVGGMHAAAITGDKKSVLTWGVNDDGTLGRDTTNANADLRDVTEGEDGDDDDSSGGGELDARESTPTAVAADKFPANTRFVSVAAGDSATFAVTVEGQVYGWGTFRDENNIFGFTVDPKTHQVIGGLDEKGQKEPILLPTLKDITSVSAGGDFALALDSNGRIFAWGTGLRNELGRRLIRRRRHLALLPAQVELPKRKHFVSIHTGASHAFAIESNGDTWAWGLNNFGQTGVTQGAGEGDNIALPCRVRSLGGKRMRMLAGGNHHSIGVTDDGECLAWGRTDGGQLGLDVAALAVSHPDRFVFDEHGKPRILLEPSRVPIPGRCVFVAAGPEHNIALTESGEAYSWGFNVNDQCGQADGEDIPIARHMQGKQIVGRKVVWAGCGGQYSMLATRADDEGATVNGGA